MPEFNRSTVTEFILTGFPGLHPEYQGLVSAILFLVYLLTLTGNVTILFLFATNRSLHKPMYYIILNLCQTGIPYRPVGHTALPMTGQHPKSRTSPLTAKMVFLT
uniref:G-protein coupled receptors family 1 profile domain-containing protein n=1 Tax=Gasterosteus aculeatus aculeatus TaxID=481459 RepID=A0AAQ4PJJ5_GASAC